MKRFSLFLATLAFVAACDSGPDGPGDVTASVQASGQDLGAAVLQIVGGGIEDFSGTGGTKVLWAQQENPVLFRVVVIASSGGDLDFSVTVQDRGGRLPRATVVAAVDALNQPIPVTDDLFVSFVR